MSIELEQLQNTVHLFLKITGGPSVALCHYLLKIIDFLQDPDQSKSEMTALTYRMLISIDAALAEYTKNTLYKVSSPSIESNKALLAELTPICGKLISTSQSTSETTANLISKPAALSS